MFMSTRYRKRPEPSLKQQCIFSVNDSLAKLFEYLTIEFSCRKLITSKWKDFRSQKLEFDQKTRLNNAIWRAWHIQYKLNKKARFFQFAAPFSDETVHSTSQAVILEGKYWKRRLDSVSREFKKWRKLYKEKLLDPIVNKEQLEVSDEEVLTDDDTAEESDGGLTLNNKKDNGSKSQPSTINSYETLSAMYAFPDTLFSSANIQKKPHDDSELALFKDSSGMIQPSLDHLNPCFDELMENFDFLFSDWSNYSSYTSNPARETPDMMLETNPYSSNKLTQEHFVKDDQFLPVVAPKRRSEGNTLDISAGKCANVNMPETTLGQKISPQFSNVQPVMLSQNHRGKTLFAPLLKNFEKKESRASDVSSYQELPPQLQAPNLTAHLQAAMSRPKSFPRNNSDSSLSMTAKRLSNKKEITSTAPAKKPCLRRNTSSNSFAELEVTSNKDSIGLSKSDNVKHQLSTTTVRRRIVPCTVTPILPKSSTSSVVPILPKYITPSIAPYPVEDISKKMADSDAMSRGFNVVPRLPAYNATCEVAQELCSPVIFSLAAETTAATHPVTVLNTQMPQAIIKPIPSTNKDLLLDNNLLHPNTLPSTNINDQQLLALAQLLQSSQPAQGTEATLSYLELLQQQLNLMLKQQQEQIQMKYQIQLQAEKMLQQQTLRNVGYKLDKQIVLPSTSAVTRGEKPLTSPVICNDSWKKVSFDINSCKSDKMTPQHSSSVSPKLIKKEQSLVKTLQRMNSSVDAIDQSKLLPIPHVSSVSDHLPTTLDSAMTLVSLRHGTLSPNSSKNDKKTTLYDKNSYTEYDIKNSTQYDTSATSGSLSTTFSTVTSLNPDLPQTKAIPQVTDRNIYNEHRRQCHLSAEQKRRGLIKRAFEELTSILPGCSSHSRASKLSNAIVLQRTCEHIQYLQRDRASSDVKMNQVQQQIDELHASISAYQNKLPDTGIAAPLQGSDDIQKFFFDHCREMTYRNYKSWIFCVLIRPLFDSYNKYVITKSVEEFLNSVIRWLDQFCSLPLLRPVLMDTLTKLSTNTPMMEDPDCLSTLATSAIQREDPTEIASIDDQSISSASAALTSFQQSKQN